MGLDTHESSGTLQKSSLESLLLPPKGIMTIFCWARSHYLGPFETTAHWCNGLRSIPGDRSSAAPPAMLLDEAEECNISPNLLLVTLTANSVLTIDCGTGREGHECCLTVSSAMLLMLCKITLMRHTQGQTCSTGWHARWSGCNLLSYSD